MTTAEIQAALKTMAAVCDTIKELDRVPSGTLYATLMSRMDLPTYEAMIRQILRTGLVRQENHLLIWVG